MSVTLVLGGARSGKSRFAESLSFGARYYVATAQAFDDEMKQRIALHQKQRGDGWITHEEIYDLPQRLEQLDEVQHFILVDCLTLWLSNLMLARRDVEAAAQSLISVLQNMKATTVLVSNEVGLGIVPDTPLGRAFRDEQGRLNQQVAAIANDVVFLAAGLPLVLKGQLPKAPQVQT